jgi:hypothetical protein
MRTISAAQQAVLDSGVQAEHMRLWVRDADGNWRDLTTWPGFNAVLSLTVKGAINDPHATFDATLARSLFALSLSPFMEDSALNRAFDPSNDFEPLLQLNREVKIEAAIVPMDTAPESGDWFEIFQGRIDHVDAASGTDVTIGGRDLGGRLAQAYIKKERVYAFAEDGGDAVSVRIWAPEIPVTAGEYFIPATRGSKDGVEDPGYNKVVKCATSGTTGTVEPVWTTGAGQADGSAAWDYVGTPTITGFDVEEIIANILDDNAGTIGASVNFYVPVSPLWEITEFMRNRGFVLDATRSLATQIGWDLRYLYDEGTSAWRYTLYEPERDSPSVDHVFAAGEYQAPTKLEVDIADLRNSVTVIFKDSTDLYPDGTPKRKEVSDTDAASITKYDQELWSELQEGENGNIDTPTEVARLIAAFLSDCSEPTADMAVPLTRGFPWVELNDYYTFSADNERASGDLSLAVTSWQHSWEGEKLSTTLEVRGKPTLGHKVHLDKEFHHHKPPKNDTHRLQHFHGPRTASPVVEPIIGGARVKISLDNTGKYPLVAPEFEVHVYPISGTTLDDTTLVAVTSSDQLEIANLDPGKTYYKRTVERHYNGAELVRGEPSAEIEFVAGRGKAAHLHQHIEWGRLPLGGGFETWNDDTDVPDHWTTADRFTRTAIRQSGDAGVSGSDWLMYAADLSADEVTTETPFAVERGASYDVSWWVKLVTAATAGEVSLFVRWLDHDQATLSDDLVDAIAFNTIDANWYRRSSTLTAPAGARFGLMVIVRTGAPDASFRLHIDSVRLERA